MFQEGLRDDRNVFRVFVEGRNRNHEVVESADEVGLQFAVGNELVDVLVGRSEDSNVDLFLSVRAEGLEDAIDDEVVELILDARAQSVEVVKDENAAVGLSESSSEVSICARKRTSSMPDERVLKARAAAIKYDDRLIRSIRDRMNMSRKERFAGADRSADQDRAIPAVRSDLSFVQEASNSLRAADKRGKRAQRRALSARTYDSDIFGHVDLRGNRRAHHQPNGVSRLRPVRNSAKPFWDSSSARSEKRRRPHAQPVREVVVGGWGA